MSTLSKPSLFWKFSEELSLFQSAVLILGYEPSDFGYTERQQPKGYDAVEQAIKSAIKSGAISGKLVYQQFMDINGNPYGESSSADTGQTVLSTASLKQWLSDNGIRDGFFFPEIESNTPEYLNKSHPNYSYHLHLAIQAWEAMQVEGAISKNKTPKNTMKEWLVQFELSDEAIERIATIANWKKGGAA